MSLAIASQTTATAATSSQGDDVRVTTLQTETEDQTDMLRDEKVLTSVQGMRDRLALYVGQQMIRLSNYLLPFSSIHLKPIMFPHFFDITARSYNRGGLRTYLGKVKKYYHSQIQTHQ